jgi:predicted nucleotidyltransferase
LLSQDPFWKIKDGSFVPLSFDENTFSEEAKDIINNIRKLDFAESIYIRGSIIENSIPFERSDLDLFIIYSENRRFQIRKQLERFTSRDLDIKWLHLESLEGDYVFYSLLSLRSHYICGDKIDFGLIRNDREFAWMNWVKYFPSGVPNELNCSDRFSVIYFKQLVRSFGVIMLLKDNKFSRDIDICIEYSSFVSISIKDELYALKNDIEDNNNNTHKTNRIKTLLKELFDEYF